MNNPIIVTIFAKLVAILGCLAVAAYQINRGFRLYHEGKNTAERNSISWGNLKISTSSSGAVVMALATFWVIAVVHFNPSYEDDTPDRKMKVAEAPQVRLNSASIVVDNVKQTLDQEKLLNTFKTAVFDSKESGAQVFGLTVNGATSKATPASINVETTDTGQSFLNMKILSPDLKDPLDVTYKPVYGTNVLTFIPMTDEVNAPTPEKVNKGMSQQ